MRFLLLFVLFITNGVTVAQDYPTRPVRIIEPFGAGGGPDLVARAISPKLSELWGQPVTVENHPGKGSTEAPALVAKSPPDGYTLLVSTSAQAYSAALVKTLPYDPLKDFIPVAPLTNQPYVLVAGKSSGITSVGELIVAAKAKPGELKFGSTGVGTGTHLGLVKFNLQAGIEAVHMPPRPGDAITDVIANAVAGRTTYFGRYPRRQAPCARRDHEEALILVTGRADYRGSWRPQLRLSDLVWSLGARRHSCWSSGQTSEGHRACVSNARYARLACDAWRRSHEHDAA